MVEAVVVGGVVLVAVGFLVSRGVGAWKGKKGTCKSCSDVCGCALTRSQSD